VIFSPITKNPATGARWPWAALAGVGVALLTYGLMYLVVTVYVASVSVLTPGDPDAAQLARFTSFVGVWGMPTIHLLLTFAAAYWMVRRASGAAAWQGALVGLISTIGNQLIGLFFGPLLPEELWLFLALGLCGGVLGGMAGSITRAGQEALYQASREISAARSFRGIVAAIGEWLAGSGVNGVIVWRVTSEPDTFTERGDEKLTPLAAWAPSGEPARPPARTSKSAGYRASRMSPGGRTWYSEPDTCPSPNVHPAGTWAFARSSSCR
jgi:hypothetical protein